MNDTAFTTLNMILVILLVVLVSAAPLSWIAGVRFAMYLEDRKKKHT